MRGDFMSRLEISTPDKAQLVVEGLYKDLLREESNPLPSGLMSGRYIQSISGTLSCTDMRKMRPLPYRLGQLKNLITDVLDGKATM